MEDNECSDGEMVDVFEGLEPIVHPAIGMQFESRDEAFDFYLSYSCRKGFAIVRRSTHNFYGLPSTATFACNKGRNNPVKKPGPGYRRRSKGSQRTNCQASMSIKDYELNGKWTIYDVVIDHNHECLPDMVRYMRCHRIIPQFVMKQLEINDDAGIPKNRNIHAIFNQAGGYNTATYTERCLLNHLAKRRAVKMGDGDANTLVKYLADQQKKCSNFYYACELDEQGRLYNVFWSDGRSRSAYNYFGDVLTFDTTYLVNEYDMPFSPFVGVNHHGQSILFAGALISDETTGTYEWLFSTFLDCMNGVAPKALITDQCAAMAAAARSVFPNTTHRLCMWHLMQKVGPKLGGNINKDRIVHEVSSLVYDSASIDEFEHGWISLIETEELGQAAIWFKNLYDIREKWVPIFVNKYFWAGQSTTQRSESMNAFFDRFFTSRTALCIFIVRYDAAVASKWEKEMAEDFRCHNRTPTLVTNLPFELQFAEHYTHGMFYIFQLEVKGLIGCYCDVIREESDITHYVVSESETKKSFEVTFCTRSEMYHCACLLFQFKGIVCRHGLAVYRQKNVQFVPDCYVIPRWRKDFVRTHTLESVSVPQVTRNLSAYDAAYKRAHIHLLNLVECTYRDDGAVDKLVDRLAALCVDLCKADGHNILPVVDVAKGPNYVLDPLRVKRTGRPRVLRSKPGSEKPPRKYTRRANGMKAVPTMRPFSATPPGASNCQAGGHMDLLFQMDSSVNLDQERNLV